VENVIQLINPLSNVHIERVNLDHTILFQPLALNQIISNLLSNAIKYNDKEVTEIAIMFDPAQFSLSVKDNGPGIDEKYHIKVFEMFQTLGNQSKGESSTGIGLSLVKKLVERNDVNIKINSHANSGSEFLITDIVIADS
jgi:two-component system sensor histidine kinase/response regulator